MLIGLAAKFIDQGIEIKVKHKSSLPEIDYHSMAKIIIDSSVTNLIFIENWDSMPVKTLHVSRGKKY